MVEPIPEPTFGPRAGHESVVKQDSRRRTIARAHGYPACWFTDRRLASDLRRRDSDSSRRRELRQSRSRALRHDEVALSLVERERTVELRPRIPTG